MQKFIIACCFLVAAIGLSALYQPFSTIQSPTIERVRTLYIEGLHHYQQALLSFEQALHNTESTPASWQKAFRQVRTTYKHIEFLLAYLDEENTRDFLNGPPLPSVNRVVAGVEVIEPSGMQVIEEILYAEDAAEQQSELLRLAQDLIMAYRPIMNTQIQLPLTDRQVMEAVRAGIFRITALGLTGFDTPASGMAIEESAASLQAMQQIVALYLPYCPQKPLADSIAANFVNCIDMMRQHPDFDSFDRINCIRNFLEPLYGQILRLHTALGIEYVFHVTKLSQPLEYLSPSMFSEKTFNDHYYAGIGAREEKPVAVELGRLLFFDPILSANNQRACASCHQPEKGFTDGLPKSLAIDFTGTVGRNAPTVINSIIADKFFYDLRADRIESQAEHVILNPQEFNTDYFEILDKINQSATYRALFWEAFGHAPNVPGLIRALAAYIRSLKSFNSPVDRYLRGEDVSLDPKVMLGFNLFMGKALCGTCHFAPTFSGLVPPQFKENESEVIGVPVSPFAIPLQLDPDLGRYANGRPRDRAEHFRHSFKTPTVRNVALTAPYMHNGAYPTLESVVDFYNRGGGAGLGLQVPHQTLPFDHLNLTEGEQEALVRFMEALTDTAGMTARPARLPAFDHPSDWNRRAIGGSY